MKREDYRRAFDAIPFSQDFAARTEALLRDCAREGKEEKRSMHFKKTCRMAVLIAASVAVLAVSVSAAVRWLTPVQVAERIDDPLLAQAFAGEDALLLDETVQSGDYTITLGGLVSGADISRWRTDADAGRTYVVASVAHTDGTPLSEDNFEIIGGGGTFTITPLVAGYSPMAVNSWTLGGGCCSFFENGIAYYVLDTQDFQMFADRTVYLAAYEAHEGFVPSYDTFSVAEDGTYSLRPGVTGALFTLPLDKSLADLAAAQAFVESTGMDCRPMTDEELAALKAEKEAVDGSEQDGGQLIIVQEAE